MASPCSSGSPRTVPVAGRRLPFPPLLPVGGVGGPFRIGGSAKEGLRRGLGVGGPATARNKEKEGKGPRA